MSQQLGKVELPVPEKPVRGVLLSMAAQASSMAVGPSKVCDRGPLLLSGLSLASYALFYLVTILLARLLTIPEFDDYNVAVSSLLILAALAPLGLEKFALRSLPQFGSHGQWDRARGYWRFSLWVIGGVSVALAVLFGAMLETTLALNRAELHLPIVIIVGALPIAATCLFLLEVASAYGDPFRSAALYRVLLPVLLLLLNGAAWAVTPSYSAVTAAYCYGLAWTFCAVGMHRLVRRMTPAALWSATPIYEAGSWLRQSTPLLINSLLLTVLAQSGVIILELMRPSEPVVSIYAVSVQTGSLVVLLATSTNRYYLPRVAVCLINADYEQLRSRSSARLKLLGPLCTAFLLLILLLGRPILSLFGPEFVAGYGALCVVSMGATISTLFAVSPYCLQFAGHNVLVNACTLAATLVSVAVCFPLAQRFGALGAAIAYAAPLAALFAVLAMMARGRLAGPRA